MGDLRAQGSQVGFSQHNAVKQANPTLTNLLSVAADVEVGYSREDTVQEAKSIISEATQQVDEATKSLINKASGAREAQALAEQQGRNKGGAVKLMTQTKLNELKLDNKRFVNEINLATQTALSSLGSGGGGKQTHLEKTMDVARARHAGDPQGRSVDWHMQNILNVEAMQLEATKTVAMNQMGVGSVSQQGTKYNKTQQSNMANFHSAYPTMLQEMTTEQIQQDIGNKKNQEFQVAMAEWEARHNRPMTVELQGKIKQDIDNRWGYVSDAVTRGDPIKILEDKEKLRILEAGDDMAKIYEAAPYFQHFFGKEEGKWFPEYAKFISYAAKGRDIGFVNHPEWIPLFDKLKEKGLMEKIMTRAFGQAMGASFSDKEVSPEEQEAIDMIAKNSTKDILSAQNMDNETMEAVVGALGYNQRDTYDLSVLATDKVRNNLIGKDYAQRTFKRMWVPQWEDSVSRVAKELPRDIQVTIGADGSFLFQTPDNDYPVQAPVLIEQIEKGLYQTELAYNPFQGQRKVVNQPLIKALADLQRLRGYVAGGNSWRSAVTDGSIMDISYKALQDMAAQQEPVLPPAKNDAEKVQRAEDKVKKQYSTEDVKALLDQGVTSDELDKLDDGSGKPERMQDEEGTIWLKYPDGRVEREQ